jgi:hypothetical protein
MPPEYPQFVDAKIYPAMEKEVMIDGTVWGHDKGPSYEKHKFVIHLATIRKGAKDRDRESGRAKFFEDVSRRYNFGSAQPAPCSWLGQPAELIESDTSKWGAKNWKGTMRRVGTDSMLVAAVVLDGGDLPAAAKAWFFDHITVDGIDK